MEIRERLNRQRQTDRQIEAERPDLMGDRWSAF